MITWHSVAVLTRSPAASCNEQGSRRSSGRAWWECARFSTNRRPAFTPRDTARLIASLRRLPAQGNSVLIVEHDASIIQAADWVVDLGPGAGPDGGAVVAAGPPGSIDPSTGSITARYLGQMPSIDPTPTARLASSPGWIEIRGALGS